MTDHPRLDAVADSTLAKYFSGGVRTVTLGVAAWLLLNSLSTNGVLNTLVERSTEQGAALLGLRADLSKEHDDATRAAAAASEAARLAAATATQAAKDIVEGRAQNLPRLDKLEDLINSHVVPDLAAIKQHVIDTDDRTRNNQEVFKDTRDDTKAIRDKVAPKGPLAPPD
jgi:hypothetical protein